MDLRDRRHSYERAGLDVADVDPDPFAQFARWYAEAEEALADSPHEVNAMTLATAAADGAPDARVVLLKEVDAGFVFYSNRESRKGEELAANPRAALVFLWHPLNRQVRISGRCAPVDDAQTAEYFAQRPPGSRRGAWASQQSRPIADRAALRAAEDAIAERFPDDDAIPVPPFWGGYRVTPLRIEFWQGRPNRLHDRIVFTRPGAEAAWEVGRLQP